MKLNDEQTVIVETLTDIKRVIHEFMPGNEEKIEVHAQIKVGDKNYDLSAPADCNYREMLIEGFQTIDKRLKAIENIENNEIDDIGLQPINIDGRMWLDDLIERRLGGKRDGMRVKWEIKEGIFYFEPFEGKLSQCQ